LISLSLWNEGVLTAGPLKQAGLRSLRVHDLRHTAAASWLAAGMPLIYVQRQLGHASIRTTERHYGHLEQGWFADAANKVDAAIFGREGGAPDYAGA
jgi:integrase